MKNRSALGILFLVVFVDLVGFGMVIPVMPLYAAELGADKKWIGLLMTGYSAMQFLFAPVWGRLSDRVGRRPVLLASIGMTAVGFLGYGLAPSFGWLLASRLFAGAATANIPIAQAYIADVTPPEGRAQGMGIIGAAFGFGFILGPFLGSELSRISLGAPGFAAAGLALVNGVAALLVLPEPEHRFAAERARRLSALRGELRRPGIRRLLLVYFLSITAFSAMEATFSLLARDRFGLDREHVGRIFAYIGIIVAVVQGFLTGPLTRRFGETRLMFAGMVLQAAGLAALPVGSSLAPLLVTSGLLAVGSALTSPAMTSLLSRHSRAEDQGGTLGIGQSAAAFGRIIGPEAGTWTFAQWSPATPYLSGAALMTAAALVGATVRAPEAEA